MGPISRPMIKLEKFTATEFNDWKLNTQFGMKYLNVFYTVQSDRATVMGTEAETQWIADEDFCCDYLLNCLSSSMAKTYIKMKTAKEIWEALKEYFRQEEDLSKAHLVDKFHSFMFDEEKAILPQVSDFEALVDSLHSENISLPDSFVAGTIIFKLPSTWYNFKTEMYRKKMQVGLNDLKRFIRIEDENRTRHALETVSKQKAAANMVLNSKRVPNPKRTRPSHGSSQVAGPSKRAKKFKGKCFICNKWGHSASDCRLPKREKTKAPQDGNQANMVSLAESSDFVAMVGNAKASTEWYLDSGATCHVCNNADLMTGLTAVKESVTVANGETADVLKVGNATLLLSSDDCSRFCHIYLLKIKDEAFEKFCLFKTRVENQLYMRIKRFRSDREGEYMSSEFRGFLASQGIIAETTAPYSPQSNDIAERKNRTLTEMLNSMLLTAGMPTAYWGEAVLTANNILNKVPHAKLDVTPYELWFKRPPTITRLKTWGCIAYVRVSDPRRSKLGPRTNTCVYLGCAEDSAADRFLDLSNNIIIESRDAVFFEDKFLKDKNLTIPGMQATITEEEPESVPSTSYSVPVDNSVLKSRRTSVKERTPRTFGSDFVTYHVEADPSTYKDTMRSRDSLL
ncbi:hypothetical protein KSP39_PZI022303 [Platanthera zijinensis]|uniref:Uncharacterized protein n=1 Tax=Platanthera zijinensis TaxID=2320716 RepID=A0AAP0FUQ9_9ASPA